MGLVTTADGDSVELVAAVPYGTQSFRVRSPLWRVRLQRPPYGPLGTAVEYYVKPLT